ncbi:MAG: hypothetical protein ACK6A4_05060, partial [Alphaproteobacteria bacterium]
MSNARVVRWIGVITAVNIGIVLALTQCTMRDSLRPAPAFEPAETPSGTYLAARYATYLTDADAA